MGANAMVGVTQSTLGDMTDSLTQPTEEQSHEQLFSMSAAQYNGLTNQDFMQTTPQRSTSQGRRNLGETLAAMRSNSKKSAAEVYTRSLLWDQVPSEVVRNFAKLVSDCNSQNKDCSTSAGWTKPPSTASAQLSTLLWEWITIASHHILPTNEQSTNHQKTVAYAAPPSIFAFHLYPRRLSQFSQPALTFFAFLFAAFSSFGIIITAKRVSEIKGMGIWEMGTGYSRVRLWLFEGKTTATNRVQHSQQSSFIVIITIYFVVWTDKRYKSGSIFFARRRRREEGKGRVLTTHNTFFCSFLRPTTY